MVPDRGSVESGINAEKENVQTAGDYIRDGFTFSGQQLFLSWLPGFDQ